MTERTITDMLNSKYIGNNRYKCANIFLFGWESDFFVQKYNGYSYDFEVKISRSDFFAEMNKVNKHKRLKENKESDLLPNKFYFVVPSGLVDKSEVPEYAGLIYYDNIMTNVIKEAPFIHRLKHQLEPQLCNKFYGRWLTERQRSNQLEYDFNQYRLKNPLPQLSNKG